MRDYVAKFASLILKIFHCRIVGSLTCIESAFFFSSVEIYPLKNLTGFEVCQRQVPLANFGNFTTSNVNARSFLLQASATARINNAMPIYSEAFRSLTSIREIKTRGRSMDFHR